MATSVQDAIESGSLGQDAATLQFRRLERVRARQRARRRLRFIRATALVMALAGIGVVGFTALHRTSVQPPGASPVRGAVSDAAPPSVAPPAAREPAPRPAIAPAAPRDDAPAHDATRSRRTRVGTDPPTTGESDRSRRESPPAEIVDATAVIDWLLNTSPTDPR
jgi:hypothetical protein